MTPNIEKLAELEQQEQKQQHKTIDLDTVYREIGEFKRHQINHYALLTIPITLACTMLFNYFFVSAILDYR